MPKSAPAICQLRRCSGVALFRRGNHSIGTVIVRPSSRSTLNVVFVKRTSTTRSPALSAEVLIPMPHECVQMLACNSQNPVQLNCAESNINCNSEWIQPDLGSLFASINMDVRRLAQVMAVEVEAE